MILLIVSILITIIAVGGIVVAVYILQQKQRKKNKKLYFLSVFGLLGMLILLLGCFTKVEANQVGIIYDEIKGGIQDSTYTEGLHKKSIFEHITQISTANRSASVTTTGQTNDGQYATFNLSIIYNIQKENAGKFYRTTNRTDIPTEALNTLVKACLQSSTINYDIFELLSTGLETARIDFKEDLTKTLMSTYYITLVNVSFDDIDGGQEVETILSQKAEAEQKIKVAELQATANLITAENQAKIEKTLAEAQAYAIRIEGEANGEAANAYIAKVEEMIETLHQSMLETMSYKECTDIVLSIIFYDTWDGKLPEVLTSDALSSLIGSLITNK
ncbi:MAG: hypothetical protein K2I42_04685 [Anaeroplasmataceae bacterium]|nr:hypothetical protein [Anaeroplasmataceae bacterium]